MKLSTLGRLVLPAMMMTMAHAAFAAMPEEIKGHFLDVSALLENRADTSNSPLLANIKAPHLEAQPSAAGYRVNSAMLVSTQGKPDGFIVLVNRDDGAFTALVNTAARSGLVVGKADGTQTFQEEPKSDREDDYVMEPQPTAEQTRRTDESPSTSAVADQPVVLTVLAGFSHASAERVGDPTAFAQAQIETLNMALRNTGLPHIKAVLAGVSTTPIDYEISSASLAMVQSLFPNHPKADLIASFVETASSVNGIAYVNGRISMTHVTATTTFAHEIGHNIGGIHCPEGNGYHYGYFTGEFGSLLCRKGTRFLSFSNPAKRAPDFVPLGDPATADMARLWRERAPGKSSGEGNDMTRPVLLINSSDPIQCLDVLGGNPGDGSEVGLWGCDQTNPNQRWYKGYYDDKIQFTLAAKPSLCLRMGVGTGYQSVSLAGSGCANYRWVAEGKALRTSGYNLIMYLVRFSDNRLVAVPGKPADPDDPRYHWLIHAAD